eukprot:TRINITY_DN13505_c0_g1_i4.p1 TRINITY_DN13505_c0_g1~~TRINITY_DN13505_c0_g1_i4.p1  ORF type:complete len:220 (+),score=35.46 TRINITY_DN13505_c0_g1_i4:74-733(+)
MDEDPACAICLESLLQSGKGRQSLSCGHVLHEQCVLLMRRFGASARCPWLCRSHCTDLSSAEELLANASLHLARGLYEKSLELLNEILSIDPEHVRATFFLGFMHFEGKGCTQDLAKARTLFEQAHAAGVAQATSLLGLMHFEGEGVTQDLAKARTLFEQAHAAGDAEATCYLGLMHFEGKGVTQDLAKARTLFEQAQFRTSACCRSCPGNFLAWSHAL